MQSRAVFDLRKTFVEWEMTWTTQPHRLMATMISRGRNARYLARHYWSLSPVYHSGRRFLGTDPSQDTRNHVIFSGIQPTGVPHLGNYLGALQQWVKLQNSSPSTTKLLYAIVDLHAYTMPQDSQKLGQFGRETLATLLAIGLDPGKSILFYQSSVRWISYKGKGLTGALGSSSFGALLALVMHSFYRISFSHDTVEGPFRGQARLYIMTRLTEQNFI